MRAMLKCGFFILSMALIIGLVIPTGAFAEKTIKIGAIYPLTGGAAAAGRELRAGVELAVELANNAMADINMSMAKNAGITSMGGAKIEIIFKDHEGNPTLGADLAKKLILDDKVNGLLGCYHSSVTKTGHDSKDIEHPDISGRLQHEQGQGEQDKTGNDTFPSAHSVAGNTYADSACNIGSTIDGHYTCRNNWRHPQVGNVGY